MKIKMSATLAVASLLIFNATNAQKTIINGQVKSQIIFNANANSYGTSLDGVVGNTDIVSRTGDVYLSTTSYLTNGLVVKNTSGYVGIGTIAPHAKLDVNGNIFTSGRLVIGTSDSSKFGTYSLVVNGEALFTKATVKLYTNWPDYVFNKYYQLMPLKDLEWYILTNNHLPDVPAASEVEKNGIDLGDNQAVLLQKIEELTLYIIDQDKKAEQQQQQIDALQKQLDELKALLQNKK